MHTLNDKSKKLLVDKDVNLSKLKHQIDKVSAISRSDHLAGLQTVHTLEQQINSLIKSVNRAERLLDDKDNQIGIFA